MSDTVLAWLKIAGGLAVLVSGGDLLVRGASKLAVAIRISPIVIGLTVVAFGTSAPELAVSVSASLDGKADLAIGNVVGSNIFNVLFILGLSALIIPLVVASEFIRRDTPIMIGASLLTLALGWDGNLGRLDGTLLLVLIIAYVWWCIRASRKLIKSTEEKSLSIESEAGSIASSIFINLALIAAGLVFLVMGSSWLVDGAVTIAKSFGVSELIIGLTIVAAGTSLPEVATSVMAAIKGERDIAVGNVVGSNIFNILCVLGLAAVVSPDGIRVNDSAIGFDIPVMVLVAILSWPIFVSGNFINRWEGALLLLFYIAYTIYIVMNETNHAWTNELASVMTIVVPVTFMLLTIAAWRWRFLAKPDENPGQ